MLANLPTADISIRADARAIDENAVLALADSIAECGLINPIRVRKTDGGWEVIAGAHRLTACKALGLAEIECLVVSDDDLHAELAMIDENLFRADLSPSERARQTARRKEIYEALHPETVNGATGGGHDQLRQVGEAAPRFTFDTANATGKSERVVQRDAERGQKVLGEVIDIISGTGLDTGVYLDKLKRLPGAEQMIAAQRDLRELRSGEREKAKAVQRSKIDADVKARAAREVAEILAEHVPGEWWDSLKANLYAAGAANIANELTNVTGQSIMDRRHG